MELPLTVTLTNVKDLVSRRLLGIWLLSLPTYLEGGNGVDNGDVEVLTNLPL